WGIPSSTPPFADSFGRATYPNEPTNPVTMVNQAPTINPRVQANGDVPQFRRNSGDAPLLQPPQIPMLSSGQPLNERLPDNTPAIQVVSGAPDVSGIMRPRTFSNATNAPTIPQIAPAPVTRGRFAPQASDIQVNAAGDSPHLRMAGVAPAPDVVMENGRPAPLPSAMQSPDGVGRRRIAD